MSMRTTSSAVAMLMVAAMLHVSVSAQKGYDTFNKALAAEKADGDLRAAIQLYERVVREAGKDRQLAARALLRIGDCYRRLGDAQARTAFERIVNQYGDQSEIAAEARTRLEPLAADAQSPVRVVMSLDGSIEFDGHVTADGRVPGTDWANGDVVLADVITRRITRLAAGGGPGAYPTWGENPLLSPDRKQVAYQWFDETKGQTLHQLRLAASEPGSKPRVLIGDRERIRNVYPIAWPADSRRLLVGYELPVAAGSTQPANQGDLQLAWASIADGSLTPVRRFEWWRSAGGNSLGLVSMSPDGRLLAYSAPPAQASTQRSIYVMGIDGTSVNEVVTGGRNQSPVWTPDGRRLLFVSDRAAGVWGIWSVPVQNGRAGGLVSSVRANTGQVALHGFTPAGVLFYSVGSTSTEVYVSPISADGRLPARDAATASIPGVFSAWSPDGRLLAVKRARDERGAEIVVRNIETGAEIRWSDERLSRNLRLYWLSNNRLTAGPRDQLELANGELRRAADLALPAGAVSRDGSVVYGLTGNTERVSVIDAATGQEKGAIPIPHSATAISLNPSGDALAIMNATRISIVRTDGGNPRELYVAPPDAPMRAPSFINWSPDGRWVLLSMPDRNSASLMRVPVTGGKPEPAGSGRDFGGPFDVARNGNRISYVARKESVELWSLVIDRVSQK